MTKRALMAANLAMVVAGGVTAGGCDLELGGIGSQPGSGGSAADAGQPPRDAGSGGRSGSGGAGPGSGGAAPGSGGTTVMPGTGGSVTMRGTGGTTMMRGSGGTTMMRGTGGAVPMDAGLPGSGGSNVPDAGRGDSGRCSGENPALACRGPSSCIPSTCGCSENGGWICTADCGGGRDCTDGGGSGGAIGGGPKCGDTICPAGRVCCNPSCGVCTGPDEGCLLVECPPTVAGTCDSDDDCKPVADYCLGCHCRALGRDGRLPVCADQGVQCLVDPCASKAAICSGGQCLLVTRPRV
jgi:hypothetical protein